MVLYLFNAMGGYAAAENKVVFVLDASQSMTERVSGRTLFDVEVEAVSRALAELKTDVKAAVRIYGSVYGPSQRELSCGNSELLVPMTNSSGAREAFMERASGVTPLGFSPIAFTIRQAGEDLGKVNSGKRVVVFTDGKDTCGGDLEKALTELGNLKVSLHLIALSGAELASLTEVVAKQGGEVYDGTDSTKIITAAVNAAQAVNLPRGVELPDGDGGDAGSEQGARPVLPGKLTGHIGAGDLVDSYILRIKAGDRFYVKLLPLGFAGTELSLVIKSNSILDSKIYKTAPGLGGESVSEALSFESDDELSVTVSAAPGAALAKYNLELVKLR